MEGIIREKERIEREKQEQLQALEKRLKDERNMRENEQKTFEEKLKLLKEQHEDELQRKRKEWREEYEREKYLKKICSETEDSLQSHESCTEEELIQTFLQKLLMMNYRARNLSVRDQTQWRDYDSSEDKGDLIESVSLANDGRSQSDPIHPMDVQMAVFHHADGFLKQLMVTKLSQCQYALPLLVPDPFTQEIEFPLWTFRQINKS
ncbi:hypothetical protein G5714_021873 [Onychostoma macrolepis]|uniref:Up-regulator of cell proliferation-like domain-containing protein n=1 Tax=Onychostoma macrolepis TaxID=369639 RepID=A0A7J6BU71_9TELE|nr:hypothetical protein G5714_021873 [Onychostoma macrolepis]